MVGWVGSARMLLLHEILRGWSLPGSQGLTEGAFSHAYILQEVLLEAVI